MKYKEINKKEFDKIINKRLPIGKFWMKENNKFIAIDNSTNDAWVEEFNTLTDCEKYLDGDE